MTQPSINTTNKQLYQAFVLIQITLFFSLLIPFYRSFVTVYLVVLHPLVVWLIFALWYRFLTGTTIN